MVDIKTLKDEELEKVAGGIGTEFNVNDLCVQVFGKTKDEAILIAEPFIAHINANGNSSQKSAASKLSELLSKTSVSVMYLLGCISALGVLSQYATDNGFTEVATMLSAISSLV